MEGRDLDQRPMNEVERFEVDGLTVSVHGDTSSMAEAAANEAASLMRHAVAERGVVHVMFATGNSQLAFVEQLMTGTPDVPWIKTVIFHMDEYVGVGPNHPAGFQRWIRTNIAERTRPKMVHYVDGLADPAAECARYTALLDEFPLDLCCLGIGENGHLAFNDPPVADFSDPCDLKVVALDEASRRQQVNEGHFPTVAEVPVDAITVTIPALLRATDVLAIVPEGRKARPVHRTLIGSIDPSCPATALRLGHNATLYLDRDSAALIGRTGD
jgi:glucosamine-6-phosphate deaminase